MGKVKVNKDWNLSISCRLHKQPFQEKQLQYIIQWKMKKIKKNMDNNKCGNEVLKQEQSHLEVGNKMNINIHKNEK